MTASNHRLIQLDARGISIYGSRLVKWVALCLVVGCVVRAQSNHDSGEVSLRSDGVLQGPSDAVPTRARAALTLHLGAGDVIAIHVAELPEIAGESVKIGLDGAIVLPYVGRVAVAGLDVVEVEQRLAAALQEYIREPNVSVAVVEVHSRKVSILGAVNSPGSYPVAAGSTILELLTAAGGLRQDAGYYLRLSRPIERSGSLPGQTDVDKSGVYSVIDVALEDLIQGLDPALDLGLLPGDIVSVPRGKMVYVLGAVGRPGGYVLNERKNISVLEVLALAGGLTPSAARQGAKILRPVGDDRQEIELNLKVIMKAEGADVELSSDDILIVPDSGSRELTAAAAKAGVSALPMFGLWTLFRR